MSTKHADRANNLRKLVKLLDHASNTIIDEWEKGADAEPAAAADGGVTLPSSTLYSAQRVVQAVTGAVVEMVAEPQSRLLEVSSQYFESRALHIAAEHRIVDFLHGSGEQGVHVDEIGKAVGIEPLKLARVLRCLTSIHLFRESRPDCFANNDISNALVNNEPLRAYIMLFALDLYSASDYLPTALTDPVKGPSYRVEETAFQLAVGTDLPRWSWLEERIPKTEKKVNSHGYPRANGSVVDGNGTFDKNGGLLETAPRPELETFGLAMLGGGRVFGTAHLYDYPWEDLADGTVVDVGGGVGGFDLQLSKLYPRLHFVVQDRGPVVEQGRAVWEKQNPDAAEGRVRFMKHDFFEAQPVRGAEVYWLRYILHDWSDSYCIEILSKIATAMEPNSRILIADQVMNTTLGCPELTPAPDPLPANYGYHTRYSHQRDLCMMSIINGIERTPAQFKHIIEKAGLRMTKIWECRSQVSIVECRL